MNDIRKRHSERTVRCIAFGDARPTDFTEETARGKSLAKLRALQKRIEELDAECATHDRTKMQGTSGKQDDREALTKMLAAMNKTADLVGLDYPEVKDAFRRPKANSNDQTLLSTARSIAAAFTIHKSKFVAYDMGEEFNEKLKARIEGFAQSMQRQVSGASAKASANALLDAAFHEADQELRRLDTLIRNKYGDDPATMAAWERAYRLERSRPGKNGGSKGASKKGPSDGEK
jgi:hypothetical protein